MAEGGSGISQPKAAAANAQVSYTEPNSSKITGAHTENRSQSVQSQSKPQYNPQEEQPRPDGTSEAVPVEPKDQDMKDYEPKRETSGSPSASPRSGYLAENAAELGTPAAEPITPAAEPVTPAAEPVTPAAVGANDSLDDVLVDLKKLSIGRDHDGEPDAWSRLGRSLILLVRYGPYKAAKYQVQTANGYNTQGLQKVSNLKTRISHLTYEGEDGEDHYRYSRNNIVGIVGVAFREQKDTNKDYKTAPAAFVKVKWQGIDAAHQKLLTRDTCWITKADLVRLTDLATAEQKISEAWDRQEERYNHWQGQMGRDSPDRSPTPCPLDAFKAQKEERIKRELTMEPSMPRAQSMGLDPEGWSLASRQTTLNNNERFDSIPVKQELNNDDNDLFVNNFSSNGQNANGQNANGQNANGQNANGQNANGQNANGQNANGQNANGQNANGQNANGRDTNGQDTNYVNNNALNNETGSGSTQSRPPPKLSNFYKNWLKRAKIKETDFGDLDDRSIARFEAAAFVYMDSLRQQGYVVEDDMGVNIYGEEP
ncbi:uncharacterized protein N7446_005245 [Penicillium canescens]|uniref:Uncharacterized protein n=1 Tax=Penicillium canescens TaxID=5083 RepID=A0AAD6I9T4_PENCN|nr:uncharacterized protein N7446_005245 [Penicillium canescens]KAJ6038444.1 hypothetical protein N7460_008215 [Penicillium canescens]KAJ6068208.1 hypothetical protein N7446_005245 [Penicillium canescens]